MKLCIVIFTLFLSLQCFSKPIEVGSRSEEAIEVSVYYLLSNPDKFNGKLVRFFGVITLEFEGTAIYSDFDSFKYFISKNALSLDFRNSSLSLSKEQEEIIYGKYVEIQRVFHGNPPTEPTCLLTRNCVRIGANYAGTLSNIKFLQERMALR